MARLLLVVAIICFSGIVSTEQLYPSPAYFYPIEHRSTEYLIDRSDSSTKELVPSNSYEYTIIPNDETAVTEYDEAALSLWDYVPSAITVITAVATKSLKVIKCVAKSLIPKVLFIGLGVALVIGFCAFTPYCTLIIEKPFLRELRSIGDTHPYLDYAGDFLIEAYNKYKEMRNV